MDNLTKTQKTYNGFAIEITDFTDLGLAMLIAESEDGTYEPVAVVSNLGEAREVARRDFRDRMRRLAALSEGMCAYSYKAGRAESTARNESLVRSTTPLVNGRPCSSFNAQMHPRWERPANLTDTENEWA